MNILEVFFYENRTSIKGFFVRVSVVDEETRFSGTGETA